MKEVFKGSLIDEGRDALLSEEGKTLAEGFYTGGRTFQKSLAQAAITFSYGDTGLAQRIYDYFSQQHSFPSSPIFSNAPEGEWASDTPYQLKEFWSWSKEERRKYWKGPTPSAMPIACFLAFIPDSIKGQIETIAEISHLSVLGGGTALHSQIRAVSEKAPGPIPYIKSVDGIMGYYRQAKTRKGATAVYMDVSHPDIMEFIRMRTPSGGDSARKIDNRAGVHHGVNITEEFIKAYETDSDFNLRCPKTGKIHETVKAKDIWIAMLEARELTGEPFMWFIDVANDKLPEAQKRLGLKNNGSNLCSEISLATSEERTAVCCLSSLNLEHFDEWKDTQIVEDMVKFLDNVLQWFIDFAPPELERAVRSAEAERAIGLGAMGFAYYLQRNMIPFESGGFNSASQKNFIIFNHIHRKGIAATQELAKDRGEPSDLLGTGRRNSHVFAVAPNSNSAILCNTSPSCEPLPTNAYIRKGRAGAFLVKNKYLERLLHDRGHDTEAVWKIIQKEGVGSLACLSDQEKEVFKNAWEMDQHWLVQHAEDRQDKICQAQSLNLFFPPGSDRAYIASVHRKGMVGRKVKSFYYFKTGAEVVADTIKAVQRAKIMEWDTEACAACQA